MTAAPAIDAKPEVSIERVEERSSVVVRVRNTLPIPIQFPGHSPTSPLFRMRTRVHGRPWREEPFGTCGTGLGRHVLTGRTEFTFSVSLPRWVEIAPESTGIQVGVVHGDLASEAVSWSPAVEIPPVVLDPDAKPDEHRERPTDSDGEYMKRSFSRPSSPCAELANYLLQSRDTVTDVEEMVLRKHGGEWRARLTEICNFNLGKVDLLENAMLAYARHCGDVHFRELGVIRTIRTRCTTVGIE